jgi:hypothetical protein
MGKHGGIRVGGTEHQPTAACEMDESFARSVPLKLFRTEHNGRRYGEVLPDGAALAEWGFTRQQQQDLSSLCSAVFCFQYLG